MMLLMFDTESPLRAGGDSFYRKNKLVGPIQLTILGNVMAVQFESDKHRYLRAKHTGISGDWHITLFQETPARNPSRPLSYQHPLHSQSETLQLR